MPGRRPKDGGGTGGRQYARHDWVDVVDVPFTGKRPLQLPAKRRVLVDGAMKPVPWEPMTLTWWRSIRSMPHCILWARSDWFFAISSAVVADNAFRGVTSAAAELRRREAIMGTTADSRKALRIRYVHKVAEPRVAIVPSTVASIDERRRRSVERDGA